ncbi:hypothetical protein CCP3SC1AL1_320004 [Gammaproteobacteria bacterium]
MYKEEIHVGQLSVHPKLINGKGSGKGIGSALLYDVIKQVYKDNKSVRLMPSPNAVEYYKKIGFEKESSSEMILTPKRIKELYGK